MRAAEFASLAPGSPVTALLARARPRVFDAYAIIAAFSAYFCMYAFRKPFAAGSYEGEFVFGLELKVALVISQVLGYALSKFLGIRFVSETARSWRVPILLGLIAVAWISLLAFAFLPPAGQVVALFCNGLPLGAVWGLVFSFLEGRRSSEILGAGLSASYIVASGAVKSVGRALLGVGVTEAWMPALTALLFVLPFAVALRLLAWLPAPSSDDEAARVARRPMGSAERRAFFRRYWPGFVLLTALYMLVTAYRDFRDNFAAELWVELGRGDAPALFTYSELPVAFAVLLALALIYRVRDNWRALSMVHGVMLSGTALLGLSTLAYDAGWIGELGWMVALGTGLYLAYVPYGCVLFDRVIAATGAVGTAVFMIYVTDAFGYLGAIGVLLYRTLAEAERSWLSFFRLFSYGTSLLCTAALACSWVYFARRRVL